MSGPRPAAPGSERDGGQNAGLRAWVVFCGGTELWWLALLKPGFRHCFALLADAAHWIVVDPLAPFTEVAVLDREAVPDLVAWYRDLGMTVVDAPLCRDLRRPAPLAPFTCVEAVKRLVGLHARFVLTPWQLYRRLTRDAGLPGSPASPTDTRSPANGQPLLRPTTAVSTAPSASAAATSAAATAPPSSATAATAAAATTTSAAAAAATTTTSSAAATAAAAASSSAATAAATAATAASSATTATGTAATPTTATPTTASGTAAARGRATAGGRGSGGGAGGAGAAPRPQPRWHGADLLARCARSLVQRAHPQKPSRGVTP